MIFCSLFDAFHTIIGYNLCVLATLPNEYLRRKEFRVWFISKELALFRVKWARVCLSVVACILHWMLLIFMCHEIKLCVSLKHRLETFEQCYFSITENNKVNVRILDGNLCRCRPSRMLRHHITSNIQSKANIWPASRTIAMECGSSDQWQYEASE